MLEKAIKQIHTMLHIMRTPRLANRMHSQLRISHIDRPRAQRGTEHRPNSASARTVVAHHKQLQRHALALARGFRAGQLERSGFRATRAFLQQHDARRVGGVALVGVYFDHRAGVHVRFVLRLVFVRVVGVDAVGHVGGDEEGGREGLLVRGGSVVGGVAAARAADFVVALFAGRGAAGGQAGEAADYARQHAAVGALGGGAADFFVVEAGYQANCVVVGEGGG